MLVCDKKIVFCHIPRSGGCSVENYFDVKASSSVRNIDTAQHVSLGEYSNHYEDLEEYFVFTFVRNPWDRLWSQYKYRSFLHKNYSFDNVVFNIETYFKDYYRSDVDNPSKEDRFDVRFDIANYYGEFIHLPSQTDFLKGKYNDSINKLPYLDYFGKFENLKEDLDTIYDKIGFAKTKLLHKNKSNVKKFKHYTEIYSDKAKEFVKEKYKEDIINFGYEF